MTAEFRSWDCYGLRDDVREVVVETIGHEKTGVWIVDETGFLRQGTRSAGMARQYAGTGKLPDRSARRLRPRTGLVLIDRGPYLPKTWTEDYGQRRDAGIAGLLRLATKLWLAQPILNELSTRASSASGMSAGP